MFLLKNLNILANKMQSVNAVVLYILYSKLHAYRPEPNHSGPKAFFYLKQAGEKSGIEPDTTNYKFAA